MQRHFGRRWSLTKWLAFLQLCAVERKARPGGRGSQESHLTVSSSKSSNLHGVPTVTINSYSHCSVLDFPCLGDQWECSAGKALAVKPDGLKCGPGTHMMEEKTES